MKFGFFITQIRGTSLAKNVQKAEELGFESAWIAEHIVLPVEFASRYPYSANGRFLAPADVPLLDPMLALAYAAAVTSKIRLATGVYVLPLRNPFATAKAVATLDTLSDGRFIFGIGIGWLAEEFEVVGMNFKDRAARTAEYLGLMTELWSKSDPSFEGRTVKEVRGVKFMPKTVQQPHPPFVFGGTSDAALRRTARLGDGWYGIAHSLDEARELIGRLRGYEREQKRETPTEITLSLRTGGPLTEDLVRRLAEMGVDRTLAGTPIGGEDSIAAMTRFHEQVMSRL